MLCSIVELVKRLPSILCRRGLLHRFQSRSRNRESNLIVAIQLVREQTNRTKLRNKEEQAKVRVAVRLTVSDNGPGFPARILTRAFEPYVTTKAKGTGLGLAMVKKIVDEHGARIDIRNRLKAGDVIEGAQISILFLQLADDDAAAPGTGPRTAHGNASQGMTKATVQTRAA